MLTPTTPLSLSVLVSFQVATVSVVRGSQQGRAEDERGRGVEAVSGDAAATIAIPKNHALFSTQDLVHAGDGYALDNLRYHMYFDHVGMPRKADETHPLYMLFGEERAAMFVRA